MKSACATRVLVVLALVLTIAGFVACAACSMGPARRGPEASPSNTLGAEPKLAAPDKRLIPIVKVAEATGWPVDAQPTAAPGTKVNIFASGLRHPRWIHVLPNGDVLVAETNAPERPDEHKGIRGKVMKKMQATAGASVPSANRITLLRDADHDGVAELRTPFIESLNSPFGMALVGSDFYVANTDAVSKGNSLPSRYAEGMFIGLHGSWNRDPPARQ